MKLSFCFLSAVVATDRPTITLDLDESTLIQRKTCAAGLNNGACNNAKNFHTRHQGAGSAKIVNKQLSSYVHSCVAKASDKVNCPLPKAKAYDHHDGLLAKVDYKIYLVNRDGAPAKTHQYKCKGTSSDEKNCIDYNVRSEWIARYDASDASGNAAEQVVFAIILNDPIKPKWVKTPKGQRIEAGAIGSVFNVPTFKATDNYDGANCILTKSKNTISKRACTPNGRPGHAVTFTASDRAGMFGRQNKNNKISYLVTYQVSDTIAPVCKITSSIASTYECGVDKFKFATTRTTDTFEGVIKAATSGSVNTLKTGTYPTTYCIAKDSGCGRKKGNEAIRIRKTYKVVDTKKPTLIIANKHLDRTGTLQYYAGQPNQAVKVTFQKAHTSGYTCSDICDKAVKPTAFWTPKAFKCDKPSDKGTYFLNYGCKDYTGNSQAKKTKVICEDHHAPALNLVGAATMSIESNRKNPTVWPDPGATCVDAFEGVINGNIKVVSPVDRSKLGTYTVKYTCCDSQTHKFTKQNCAPMQTRKVVVYDDHCPTCTISGSTSITREASFPYTDLGAKCSDEQDGPTSYITVGKFDVEKVGAYKITYRSKDAAGNWNDGNNGGNKCHCEHGRDAKNNGNCPVSYVRTIVVKDTLKPVISLSYNNKEFHRSKATDTGVNHGKENQANPANNHVFMAETQTSVNGWIMGAVASATAGVALLGLSTRKAAVISVPV